MTLDVLLSALGAQVVEPGETANPAYLKDWASRCPVTPLAVVRPRSVEEVSRTLEICNEHGLPVVPQGGRTGLAGGAQPLADGVVICLDRMNGAPEIDGQGRVARVQAGVTLEQVQQAAEAQGLLFAVDIGSRGSCEIGGMIATNAGGMRAFRYGMMRQNVLGLEAVLPDGTVVSAMNGFLKNNTGYDLKQLFIGAEGTLGVVTGAVLRLHPAQPARVTALLRVENLARAQQVLDALSLRLPGLSICEVMWPDYYYFASGFRGFDPLPDSADGLTLLIEAEGQEEAGLRGDLQTALEYLFEKELVLDGAISQSLRQTEEFWALRSANEGLNQAFSSIVNFDISLHPEIGDAVVARLNDRLAAASHQLRCLWLGHLGDMNLHLGVVRSSGSEIGPECEALIVDAVITTVLDAGGTISAEHGIGAFKVDYVPKLRSEAEQALSRTLRRALDPKGIMNPGRLF
ncbi:FAD-binding oxidoreductase [Pseudodonghicola flavimaris]|uniref:FAD-binding oxidoreductase n=1 Tax=Pseudodonghicola flavimaris TaxID=3050036 RepID=A0ABT7EYB9_9RHOB|nr:FAD-binding oxidoreductase [Pseudodonghicola flavimaris]MDK3017336.1 FAD-binding oxidoreductase [Pseudodonghicola flavimaris]